MLSNALRTAAITNSADEANKHSSMAHLLSDGDDDKKDGDGDDGDDDGDKNKDDDEEEGSDDEDKNKDDDEEEGSDDEDKKKSSKSSKSSGSCNDDFAKTVARRVLHKVEHLLANRNQCGCRGGGSRKKKSKRVTRRKKSRKIKRRKKTVKRRRVRV